jgi:hypothetical protein
MSQTIVSGMSGQLRSSTRPRSPGSFIDTLDAATRLQRHPAIAFGLLTLLYLIAIICLSWVKLLWLDELITLHIVQLNSVSAIWHALGAGADPNPPLLHLLVMFSRRLFGEHALALRLPAVIGYWVGMLALFLFLKRRKHGTFARDALR